MSRSLEVDNATRGAVKILAVTLSLGFVLFIGNGWHIALKLVPMFAEYWWASWIAALAIASFALSLAYFVAAERLRLSLNKSSGSKFTWVSVFLILFMVSAMGAINSLFLFTQETTIIREVFTSTNAKLKAMESIIPISLNTPNYDKARNNILEKNKLEKQAFDDFEIQAESESSSAKQSFESRKNQARAAWAQFKAEFINPLRPGFGQDARKRFEELKKFLPDLQLPSGIEKIVGPKAIRNAEKYVLLMASNVNAQLISTYNLNSLSCTLSDKAKNIYARVKSLRADLPALPAGLTCRKLAEIRENIRRKISDNKDKVEMLPLSAEEKRRVQFREEAQSQLRQLVEENEKFVQKIGDLSAEKSLPLLEKSWGSYARIYSTLRQLSPAEKVTSIPSDIADKRIRNLGNIGNILSILLTRLYDIQTYLIVFAALIIDIVMVGVLRRLVELSIPPEERNPFDSGPLGPSNPLARK